MKILMLSSFLPYPLFSGGHIRLYNLIKEIHKDHEITLVCEKRPYQTQNDIDALKEICNEVYVFERKKQWSFENIAKTGFSSYPFLLTGHTNPQMREKLANLLANNTYDVIHIETFYIFQNLPETTIPTVLVEHNIEYEVYQRYLNSAPALSRPLLSVDIKKIKHWEEFFWKKATKLVAVSESEKKEMKRTDVSVVPNGVDIHKYTMPTREKWEKRVLFIGDFKWIQNKNSAMWIIKEIWPKVLEKAKHQEHIFLWIVGKNIPSEIKNLSAHENIIFDENAPSETEKIYHRAKLLLSPIRVGGGTSYKILESMATGLPVVTTTLGNEGIGAEDKKEMLIGDTADEIANNVVSLLEDKELYEKIQFHARKKIENEFSWKDIAKKLEQVYKEAVNG